MSHTENLNKKEAVDKLKSLVGDIVVCLFCTDLKTDDGSTCRPMSAIKVCDQGNIWFFSEKGSDKNIAIAADKDVQLFFSHPGKSSYLVVNGNAEIILDRVKIEELWTPLATVWFKEGKNDPSVSVIKVTPKSAYYWDTDGSQMVNIFQKGTSTVAEENLVAAKQGALKI